jgi:hypothetical protein
MHKVIHICFGFATTFSHAGCWSLANALALLRLHLPAQYKVCSALNTPLSAAALLLDQVCHRTMRTAEAAPAQIVLSPLTTPLPAAALLQVCHWTMRTAEAPPARDALSTKHRCLLPH